MWNCCWDGLTLFLDRPEVPLDNNATERDLRRQVVGRKNFHGAGSLWSANLAAWIYTILGTWSKNGINIRTALTDYLTVCAALGKVPDDLSRLAPLVHGRQTGRLFSPGPRPTTPPDPLLLLPIPRSRCVPSEEGFPCAFRLPPLRNASSPPTTFREDRTLTSLPSFLKA
ncbi:MAG: IS66 family transposase [Leptospirillia bacterium]